MFRRLHPAITTLAMASLALLYLPMLAVAIFSVNRARYGFTWRGFTFDWYTRLLHNQQVLTATWNTLLLALISTVVATLLGTLLALGSSRYPWPKPVRAFFDFLLYLPMVTPDIIFAAALVVAFGLLRQFTPLFNQSLFTMIVAHITFQIAFVALVVASRLATLGRTIEEAARDLYANSWVLFWRVTLPLLLPGIVAGAMLAFTLSLDDFVISFFTAGPQSTTLPIFIYASVRRGITPEIHALSTLIFLATMLLVLGIEALSRPRAAHS
jgi:spermidine/putrescine transport system permease protein